MDGMLLVVDWICTACVLDVVFVHILKRHCKHNSSSATNHQLLHTKHIHLFKHLLQSISSINYEVYQAYLVGSISSINYGPAIHRDTTSCTTSSHSHTPVDYLQKNNSMQWELFPMEKLFSSIWAANSSGTRWKYRRQRESCYWLCISRCMRVSRTGSISS